MKQTDLCEICTEYNTNEKCDLKENCKVTKLIEENKKLKEQVKKLERQLSDYSWGGNAGTQGIFG